MKLRTSSWRSSGTPGDVSALERKIDQLVYGLYGLRPEEIKIVEGTPK